MEFDCEAEAQRVGIDKSNSDSTGLEISNTIRKWCGWVVTA